jgi:hypothetical protein
MGFKQRGVFELVRLEKGMKLMGMTTRFDYKITNGEFEKYKTRRCAMGNQQIAGVHFNESDLYTLVLKAHEVRLLAAIAEQYDAQILKYDTSQAFLYGDVDQDLYQIGGQNWFRKDVSCSRRRISMALVKRQGRGMCASRLGWRNMGPCQSTMRRPCS